MLSETFFSFFITSVIGCLIGIIRLGYKSKCKSCSCCGMKIERDTNAELQIDELDIERRGDLNLEESKK